MLFPEGSLLERHVGTGEYRGMEFLHVNARTIVNAVPAASKMPFRYTINAYRGCSHACTYCFARPTHTYLGLGPARTSSARSSSRSMRSSVSEPSFARPRWQGEHIAMGTNTDPYQKAEGKYHLTQGIIGVLSEAANPFSILTKSTLVLRDLGLARRGRHPDAGAPRPLDRHTSARRVAAHRAGHAASATSASRRSGGSTRPACPAGC